MPNISRILFKKNNFYFEKQISFVYIKKIQMNKNNIFKNKMQTKQLKKTYIKKRFAEPVTQIIRPDKLIKNKLKIITKPIF